MSVSRRGMLGGAAVLGAAGALGVHKLARGAKAPNLLIYDSRRPASLALVQRHPGVRRIDLAAEQQGNWRNIRTLKRQGVTAGLTGWNDYVAARQWLEERGLRVVEEAHDRRHDLIAWVMV